MEDAATWLEKASEVLAMNPRSAAQMALRAQALAEMVPGQKRTAGHGNGNSLTSKLTKKTSKNIKEQQKTKIKITKDDSKDDPNRTKRKV